jgi:hypothetical protein
VGGVQVSPGEVGKLSEGVLLEHNHYGRLTLPFTLRTVVHCHILLSFIRRGGCSFIPEEVVDKKYMISLPDIVTWAIVGEKMA